MPVTLREQLQELAEVEDRRPSQVVRRLIRLAYAEMKHHDAPIQTAQSERVRPPWPGLRCQETGTAEGG